MTENKGYCILRMSTLERTEGFFLARQGGLPTRNWTQKKACNCDDYQNRATCLDGIVASPTTKGIQGNLQVSGIKFVHV